MDEPKRVGLIGNPIKHSLSPHIHSAAYEFLGLDWKYELHPCTSGAAFEAMIKKMAIESSGYIGVNVTMPFKHAAFEAVERRDGLSAELACGINVITFEDIRPTTLHSPGGAVQKLIAGTNTDGAGIVDSLKIAADLDVRGIDALVCGTGSTSAAALVELVAAGASSVTVLSRDFRRAQSLAERVAEASRATASVKALVYDATDALKTAFATSTLIIDATPVGMNPNDISVLPVELITSHHTIMDVVYGHGETHLMREAKARGAHIFDGLLMLVEQAALTIEIWAAAQGHTLKAPRDIMMSAALAEMAARTLRAQQEE